MKKSLIFSMLSCFIFVSFMFNVNCNRPSKQANPVECKLACDNQLQKCKKDCAISYKGNNKQTMNCLIDCATKSQNCLTGCKK